MNVIQTALSSKRFSRALFWAGPAVFATGTIVLIFTLVGGSDKTSIAPEQGFRPTLPAHSQPLTNANGVRVKTFWQLDPEVRSTIRTFLGTAVVRRHLGESWNVIAPSVKRGYTYQEWTHANALPIIPYPVADVDKVQYYLDYASTKEILVEVGVFAPPEAKLRSTTFLLGMSAIGKGANKRWLVDYWMPRWTPPVPQD